MNSISNGEYLFIQAKGADAIPVAFEVTNLWKQL